jgi:polyisoprenoid-binding protein YceI
MTANLFRVLITLALLAVITACAPITLEEGTSTLPPAEAPGAAAAAAPAEVDADLRSFVIDPAASTATYRAYEEFFGRAINTHAPFTLPIGQTNAITGTIHVALSDAGLTIAPEEVVVNLFNLTSDDPRRDRQIRENYLDSENYPLATLVPREITDFPQDYAPGDAAAFQMAGDLTIRDVTNPVVFDVQAILADDIISATATTRILMPDYGFAPPRMLNFVVVQDHLDITVQVQAPAAGE